jgi:TPR repeat protein
LLKLIALAGLALFVPLVGEAAPYDEAIVASGQHNFVAARSLFTEAAQAGDPRAQYNLGRMWLDGEGGPRDYAQALSWSEKAAEQGIPAAEYNLGRMYGEGLGVRRDPRRAAAWYEKAAARGFSSAQVKLGDMYAAGRGVPADPNRAAEFYGAAAEQGDGGAKLSLATLSLKYDLGLGEFTPHARFTALMDSVFGPAGWRETGGFRTAKRENELRALGALTVAQGAKSAHSIGKPEAPGAYDLVVNGLSPEQAARKLRASKAPLKVIFPEAAHGDEGPHLHVEPISINFETVPGGHPAAADPARVERAANWLRSAAAEGNAGAQLWMGRFFARPGAPTAERGLAGLWFARAAGNPEADAATRKQASEALAKLNTAKLNTAKLKPSSKGAQLALAGRCTRRSRAACGTMQAAQ